jgi:nucleoside-diphosphate-sugar epimerase
MNKQRSSAPTRHLSVLLLSLLIIHTLFLFTPFRFFNFGQITVTMADDSTNTNTTTLTVLVVGATGATGKHVVQQLLDHQGHHHIRVKTIVRSQERMMEALKKSDDDDDYKDRLFIKQASSLLDMTDDELSEQVADVDAVVSCLGHTPDYAGVFGPEYRYLVLNVTRRLTTALQKQASKDYNNNNNKTTKRFILMSSDGVVNPAGTDGIRPWSVRTLLAVIRYLVPPHRDNEAAAQYVYDHFPPAAAASLVEWVVVRPTDLVNENKDRSVNDRYILKSQPAIDEGLFGGGVRIATRSNVARCMVDLLTNASLWNEWKFQMPCIRDDTIVANVNAAASSTSDKESNNKKEQEL